MKGRRDRGRRGSLVVGRPGVAPLVVSVVAAALVIGPGLAPGYLLVRDMVFVPSPPLTGRLLGLGHETPRAVPSDLVVALLSHALPGDLVQKLVLLALLVAAGTGAARLAPRGAGPGAAAALVAIWNPYVGERLAMGQWALLVGYAALPWVVAGVGRLARGDRSRVGSLVAALVAGSLGGGLAWVTLGLATLATLGATSLAGRDGRGVLARSWWVLALGAALALPWGVPALLRPQGPTSDPAGFSVFAPHSDTPFGVVLSLLTGGGSWNGEVVPAGRDTLPGAVGALLLLGWAAFGFLSSRRSPAASGDESAGGDRLAVLASGAVGLVIALLSAVPSLLAPLADVPGGGLLRDGSRQLGPWVLALAVGASWGVAGLRELRVPRGALVVATLLPVAVLPSLGWGLAGLLRPVALPPAVAAVRSALDVEAAPGSVVVLPFQAYRRYPWNADLTSLTPWPRALDRRVVVSSDLVVATPGGERTVAGEDPYAVRVRAALADADPARALAAAGVGWLVVDVPGTAVPTGTTRVLTAAGASLYRVDAPVSGPAVAAQDDPPAVPVLVGDGITLALAVLASGWAARRNRRSRGMTQPPTI